MARMDEFTQQYFETALWSSSDESDDSGGEPLDKNYDISDFDPATRDKMIADCADFQERFGTLIDEGGGDYGRAGHDFWLTRNGHGAGFWDGDWPEPQATKLTDASKEYGEFDLYLGDENEDGEREIYGSPLERVAREARGKRVEAPRGPRRSLKAKKSSKQPDQRAVDFFYKHAGYSQGPGETPEQGRRRGAIALAKAEQEASARGWRVKWEEDPEGMDSIGDIDPNDVREILVAVLYDEEGNVLGSLGSIVNPDRDYGRVVEAELALEALP